MNEQCYLNEKIKYLQIDHIFSKDQYSLDRFVKYCEKHIELSFFPLSSPVYQISLIKFIVSDTPIINGNHYHSLKNEFIYVIDGKLQGKYVDLDTNESITLDLGKGDLVFVAPRCGHSYLATTTSYLLEFTTTQLSDWDSTFYSVGVSIEDF